MTSVRRRLTKAFLQLFPLHSAAWEVSASSVRHLLNAPTEDEKDQLTKAWHDSMHHQLNVEGLTVNILVL
jgi:hypothetical protein